ncbi:hypothetical protein MJM95_30410, partial [Salmonella enterica subsp. enterica serovar Anatum]|nr:hypothetical protein [Salmonella enterica subsp. enterica serovar Anatum]
EKFSVEAPKTKLLAQKLKDMALEDVLIITGELDENLFLAARNETRFSELFFDYLNCIQALAGTTGSPEPALRRFELALLGHLG